jgi:hypothetical protein
VRWVTGTWSNVWLLAVPLVAIVLPIVICAIVGATIWPKSGVSFPKELSPSTRHIPGLYVRQLGPAFAFDLTISEAELAALNEEQHRTARKKS